jgi:HSP20 family protein
MTIIRYPGFGDFVNPLREMERLKREMDHLFGNLARNRTPFAASSGVFPSLNVNEDANNFYVQAELPGIAARDLEISVEGNTLTLRGERKSDAVENASYHRRERGTGRFHKALTLPNAVKSEGVLAECKNGVLKLVLPKAEQAKPRKISIKSE